MLDAIRSCPRWYFGLALLAACNHTAPDQTCDATEDCTTCGDATCGSTSSGGPSPTTTLTTADESSTAEVTTADVTSTTSTTTGEGGCRDDDECMAPTPICNMGTCVDCSGTPDPDGACAALDPDAPLCEDAVCVQCREGDTAVCTGTVPVCDAATNTCVGCSTHEQCPASACHLDEGSCMPEEVVFYVDGDADGCGAADGSMAAPYCTIAEALDQIGQASRGTVRITATTQPYGEALVIEGNRTVALLAEGDAVPELVALGDPTLLVDGSTAFVWRLRLRGNTSDPAIVLDDAVAWIDRSELVQNQGGGIAARSGSMLHLRTSIIGAGGTALADRQALRVDGSTIDVIASTIAGNDGSGAASIACVAGGGGSVRSSIVVGIDPPTITCVGLEVSDSAVDAVGLGGEGNLVVDELNPGWFVEPAVGDFHLVDGTAFDGLGVWHTGDPTVDLDGDPRPIRDGAADVAGADVP